jgi:hypothetical protein
MPDAVFGLVGILIVVMAVTVWLVLYLRTQESRARAIADYRQVVEQTTAAQQKMHDEMTEIAARVAAIHRLLQDVD